MEYYFNHSTSSQYILVIKLANFSFEKNKIFGNKKTKKIAVMSRTRKKID